MILSELLKTTRQYFWNLNFSEVEVPYLNSALPLESNLYSYKVKDWYLPTSPEFALKHFLATNPQNCFSISHCFRDLESTGPHHSPEFLMLEYYLVNKNISDLQESLKQYLSLFLKTKFENYQLPTNLPTNEPDFNQFFLNEIEPNLPRDRAVFVIGYPHFLSPLAKRESNEADVFLGALNVGNPHSQREKKSSASARFELYINGIEIANGCEENRDIEQIKLAFKTEEKYRLDNRLPSHPISQDFIKDCSLIPPCSGLGLGLDRLLMLINKKQSL